MNNETTKTGVRQGDGSVVLWFMKGDKILKRRTWLIFIVLSIFSVMLFVGRIIVYRHNKLQEDKNKVEEYLNNKYSEKIAIEKISNMETIIAQCYPENNPNISFQVVYWNNQHYSEFRDSYLQTSLEHETKNLIKKILKNYDISAEYIDVDLFEETPYSRSSELYEFYQINNRPLSWSDKECSQIISKITMNVNNHTIDQNIYNDIVKELELSNMRWKEFKIKGE